MLEEWDAPVNERPVCNNVRLKSIPHILYLLNEAHKKIGNIKDGQAK